MDFGGKRTSYQYRRLQFMPQCGAWENDQPWIDAARSEWPESSEARASA
jgi:hypothetical protein